MAYQSNIPQATDLLSKSQGDLLNNFGAIFTLVGVNHVDFGAADQGKHKWVTLPSQGATPPAGSGFAPAELGVYNAVYATSTQQELFINKTNQATVVQVPATASTLSVNSAPAAASNGYSYLPSGILIKWAAISPTTGYQAVTLAGSSPFTGPAFTQVLNVQMTPYGGGTGDANFAVRLVSIDSPSQIHVYVSSRTTVGPATGQFMLLIIGY
jgi:hypothetical protein